MLRVAPNGDMLPGLTIDRFGDVLVVQITTAGMEALLVPLQMALEEVLSPTAIILRNDAPARVLEGLEQYVRSAKGDAGRSMAQVVMVDTPGVHKPETQLDKRMMQEVHDALESRDGPQPATPAACHRRSSARPRPVTSAT